MVAVAVVVVVVVVAVAARHLQRLGRHELVARLDEEREQQRDLALVRLEIPESRVGASEAQKTCAELRPNCARVAPQSLTAAGTGRSWGRGGGGTRSAATRG